MWGEDSRYDELIQRVKKLEAIIAKLEGLQNLEFVPPFHDDHVVGVGRTVSYDLDSITAADIGMDNTGKIPQPGEVLVVQQNGFMNWQFITINNQTGTNFNI